MVVKDTTDCECEPRLCDLPRMAGQTLYEKICDIPSTKISPIMLRQLENLRGEPITFVDIHDIPCQEISADAVREIEPLVSVVVIAYNQEKYISEALEGILCQKTEFPFEIVIGEDCSTDRTREIVLEYQKKYSGRIRVLVSERNLYKENSSNLKRTILATRGMLIAFCEGDDYWIDEKKLQKQVEIFRKHEKVNAVYTGGYHYYQNTGKWKSCPICGLKGEVSVGESLCKFLTDAIYQQHRTCSSMFRRELFEKRHKEDAFDNARLFLGDRQLWLYSALIGNLYYINELTSVYRRHSDSISSSIRTKYSVNRDAALVNLFYMVQNGGIAIFDKRNIPFITDLVFSKSKLSAIRNGNTFNLSTKYKIVLAVLFDRSMSLIVRTRVFLCFLRIKFTCVFGAICNKSLFKSRQKKCNSDELPDFF